ncbi:MmcQ/YjbR family DNA-binding protein [Scandinavium goeteborgense]|uniref:Putative DNA-binding protein (MmcQ/YjbR family) n=1 Tax=Scandinavium goeteborgense TaxID=1851514 RepID=A0A4R6E7K8_SCAGO|nr:MmcQ/YjbR family DNA-binding protein [Scandinavium goeteborgense]QKN82848.1 MmcQ/YjbR family DNA-binding protein [Scandinavium goeteborgense]TDN53933.1 putative DNA-binding protein (MmcQ/YjbR family) [Scandinavium goeteborgense]
MNGETLLKHAHQFALELPFTEQTWPFGPEYDVYRVGGKIFMIAITLRGKPLINLKADPQKALLHQEIYKSIEPGYHMNKKHWITVYGGDDISPELVEDLITDSWHKVVDKLPKRDQKRLRPQ